MSQAKYTSYMSQSKKAVSMILSSVGSLCSLAFLVAYGVIQPKGFEQSGLLALYVFSAICLAVTLVGMGVKLYVFSVNDGEKFTAQQRFFMNGLLLVGSGAMFAFSLFAMGLAIVMHLAVVEILLLAFVAIGAIVCLAGETIAYSAYRLISED